MPRLRILKNTEPFCVVGSNDVWMFTASVWTDLWGPDSSTLDVTGGSKRRSDGSHDFLIWTLPAELACGDTIDMFFEAGAESTPKGEIFKPDLAEEAKDGARFKSWSPTEAELLEWESRPAANQSLLWKIVLNGGSTLRIGPDIHRQHVGLHTLWNEERPERWRVSLSRSSLREICSRSGGEELLLEYVALGSHVRIVVGA